MFTREWREHWGLEADPFACEDADKDFVLAELETSAVHTGFERVFGDPRVPAPGIVFGEKGSGKSGLRLMMKRRLAELEEQHPERRMFVVEYTDFNPFLERFRGTDASSPEKVLAAWSTVDHLDCLLSLAVTRLVDLCLDERAAHERLSRKQKVNLLLLTALYYDSRRRTTAEAVRSLRLALRTFDGRTAGRWLALALGTAAAGALAALPHLVEAELGDVRFWYGAGAVLLAVVWIGNAERRGRVLRRARRAVRSLRVLRRDAEPLASVVRSLPSRERQEFPLPVGDREDVRYEHLERLIDLTAAFGYRGWYVLMDRVDEPSLLSGDPALMSRFVEELLDMKLLQHPGLALKLFLPLELERLHRTASPEDLKAMRLDKSNLIPELKWSGRELWEIANRRLRVASVQGARARDLSDLFEEGFDQEHLRGTLQALGTPRYAFGFVSAVVQEHLKDLPGGLDAEDPAWRIPRSRFDVERAAWLDRTGVLRRTLN